MEIGIDDMQRRLQAIEILGGPVPCIFIHPKADSQRRVRKAIPSTPLTEEEHCAFGEILKEWHAVPQGQRPRNTGGREVPGTIQDTPEWWQRKVQAWIEGTQEDYAMVHVIPWDMELI